MSKNPIIGFLTPTINDDVSLNMWRGVEDAARQRGFSLLCLAGGRLRKDADYREQGNILYDLVSPQELDGLISWASTLGSYLDYDDVVAFHQRYAPLPIVSLTLPLKGAHTVAADSYRGMRDALVHLIEVHGYRHLAFIRGPETHPEVQKRYRAYTDVLEEYGIPLDPRLVSPAFEWQREMGREAIRYFVEEQKLRLGTDLDAVISVSDLFAFSALQALFDRKITVPDDVALIGFNNTVQCQYSMPPLTSVAMPFYEHGVRGVEVLHALLQGSEMPELIEMPTQLIVRQSCGCLSPAVKQVDTQSSLTERQHKKPLKLAIFSRKTAISRALEACQGEMLTEMEEMIRQRTKQQTLSSQEISAQLQRLIGSFSAEVQGSAPGQFITTLSQVLHTIVLAGYNVNVWQGVISILRRYVLSACPDNATLLQAEKLWEQARIAVGELAQQNYGYHQLQNREYSQIFNAIGRMLITTFDVEELLAIITREFPQLGIPSCSLILYENPKNPTDAYRLMMAYNRRGSISVKAGGKRIPSTRLVPEELYPAEDIFSVLVTPLHFQEEQIGFMLFEDDAKRNTELYEILRIQLSIALRGALLVQERKWAENLLEDTLQSLQRKASVVSSNSQQISERVQNVSNATEQFAQHIREMSRDVTEVMNIVKKTVDMAGQASTTILGLQNHSQEIGKILKIIDQITQQTNLLALNATIEAARAGDAGRGFGIVAQEVKELAHQTAESAKDIAQKIGMMQTSSENATEAITQVVHIIDQISTISHNIETAMSEQTENTNEIVRMIAESANDSEEITLAIAEIAAAAQDSSAQVDHLKTESPRSSSLTDQLKELAERLKE